MPTALLIWEPVVECSVVWNYLESQLNYSADYQVINVEAISVSHKAMCVVIVSSTCKTIFNFYNIAVLFSTRQYLCSTVYGSISKGVSFTLLIACRLSFNEACNTIIKFRECFHRNMLQKLHSTIQLL